MLEPKQSASLVAGATASHKKINQDAILPVRNTAARLTGVVLADGLGSHYGADIASKTAVAAIAEGLGRLTSADGLNMPDLFLEACSRIKELAGQNGLPADLDRGNAFGTTALCAIETEKQIVLSYVGNGAIFHIRGDFNTFPESQLLPWTALNYLNPHARSQEGKNVLYKLLSPEAGIFESRPTVLTLSKDQDLYGDIVLCCTDGVYSYDQTPIGRDSERKIWIYAEPSIILFLERLSAFFSSDGAEEELQACLDSYVQELKESGMMSDDCTVGVLVTETARRYQASLRKNKIDETAPCKS